MKLSLGIDIACRSPHHAAWPTSRGDCLVWSTLSDDLGELEALWASFPSARRPGVVIVVMEPTRNAWVPLAAWFRRRGAVVVVVPTEQSADLRDYFSKHTKTDRLDSSLLARLPLLHPEGLHPEEGLGPADALKRAAKIAARW